MTVNSTNSFDNDLNNIVESINASSFPERTDYLLDDYAGAAAAYSLRKIRSGYTGPLVRVRRDNDHAEAFVFPDSNGTISDSSPVDATIDEISVETAGGTPPVVPATESTLGDFMGGYDGYVVVWFDQANDSPNQNNAVQEVRGNQPKIYDGTTGEVIKEGSAGNEKPAIYFDGSDDQMVTSHTLSSTFTMMVVSALDSGASKPRAIVANKYLSNVGASGWVLGHDAVEIIFRSNSVADATAPPSTGQILLSADGDGTGNIDIYKNSVAGTSTTEGGTSFIGATRLGGGLDAFNRRLLQGTIQNIIIYNSDKSANRTGIETNINDYYSIYDNSNKLVAVYDNSIQRTIALNSASYTDLKEIIHYE